MKSGLMFITLEFNTLKIGFEPEKWWINYSQIEELIEAMIVSVEKTSWSILLD